VVAVAITEIMALLVVLEVVALAETPVALVIPHQLLRHKEITAVLVILVAQITVVAAAEVRQRQALTELQVLAATVEPEPHL
jgi:hypothetical protein